MRTRAGRAGEQIFVLTTPEEDADWTGLLIIITAEPPGEDLVLRITALHPSHLKYSRKQDCHEKGMEEAAALANSF